MRIKIRDGREQPLTSVPDSRGHCVARVHQQGLAVGREGADSGKLRTRRPGRNAVKLQIGEVYRLDAVAVARDEEETAFEAVDRQRRAPLRGGAAWPVNERRVPRRVELDLKEGRAGSGGVERR